MKMPEDLNLKGKDKIDIGSTIIKLVSNTEVQRTVDYTCYQQQNQKILISNYMLLAPIPSLTWLCDQAHGLLNTQA